MKRAGRKKPYTARGIRRMKCVRCVAPAHAQWSACADGNLQRPLCVECDIGLNEAGLRYMRDPDWKTKIKNYRRSFE